MLLQNSKKKKFIYKILTSLTGHGTSCGIYFKPISLLPFIQKINLLTSYMTYIYFFLTDKTPAIMNTLPIIFLISFKSKK